MPDDPNGTNEGTAAQVTFDVAAVRDRSAVPRGIVKLLIGAPFVVALAALGGNLVHPIPDRSVAGDPTSSPSGPTQNRVFVTAPPPIADAEAIEPGSHDMRAPYAAGALAMHLYVTVPAGWAAADSYTVVYKPADRAGPFGNAPSLSVHAVAGVVADLCRQDAILALNPVGPTVEDMTAVLTNLIGPQGPTPVDITVGGYPARRFDLSGVLEPCVEGPEGRTLWQDATGAWFGLLKGATARVYVVDIDGQRLVIATHERGASPEDVAELDAIVASIRIEPTPVWPPRPTPVPRPTIRPGMIPRGDRSAGDLPDGRYSLAIEDVPISFRISSPGWESCCGFYVSKSVRGPQDAEAILFWTSTADSLDTDPCSSVGHVPVGAPASDLAAAVAAAPGTELVAGPSKVSVGGHEAWYVATVVRDRFACDPGFFFTWEPFFAGAFWIDTEPGDLVRVWIIDIDGTRLVIEGETRAEAGKALETELQQIVDSIQFE